ncbi:MAG: peptide chain release factor-like protein [Spirochaetes bacterium]|nr:peptide chain release factor-like protein [Spirochaetota bacterium]
MYPVRPEKAKELEARLARLKVRESDLDEQFIRSQGAGGQHVNKSSTCVLLTHLPTGIQVKAQENRSQSLNRFQARRRLCELLEARIPVPDAPRRKPPKKRKQKDRLRRRRAKKYAPPSFDPRGGD